MDYSYTRYHDISRKREKVKIKPVWTYLNPRRWYDKKFNFREKKVLDFGCHIKSLVYVKTIQEGGFYFGYDVDEKTIEWLKDQGHYTDFWNTSETFDVVNASHAYEHLPMERREKFIARASEILSPGGLLLLDYPYFANLNGLRYFEDRTHFQPPSARDESLMIELHGFKTEVYLVGLPMFNWFRTFLNILCGFYPQQYVYLAATKTQ